MGAGERLKDGDGVVEFIVMKWLDEYPPSAIMTQLLCLGAPRTKAQILTIIRLYIDQTTENHTYKART